jgi:hypothetical protein
MFISHEHRFIFVKTAKTAGTSIEVLLSQLCNPTAVATPFRVPESDHEPRNYRGRFNPIPEIRTGIRAAGAIKGSGAQATLRHWRRRQRFYHHIPAWRIRNRVPSAVWDHYRKFCVVRNPWDLVISGWHWFMWVEGPGSHWGHTWTSWRRTRDPVCTG